MAEDLSDRLVREVRDVRALQAKQRGAARGKADVEAERGAAESAPAKPRSRRRVATSSTDEGEAAPRPEVVEAPAARPRTRRPPLAVWPD